MKLADNVLLWFTFFCKPLSEASIVRRADEYKRILHSREPQAGQYHLDGRRLITDGETIEYSDDDVYYENRLFNAPSFVTEGTLCAICVIGALLYLFYIDDNYIKYRTSEDSGVAWSAATSTILTTKANSIDAITCNNEIYVFFADRDAGYSGIYYITSSDGYTSRHNVTSSSDERYYVAAVKADNPDFYSEGALSGSEIVMLTFTHNDVIYLIMSDEGMNNWDVIEPIGITSGEYSDICIGASGYPVVTFTWNGRLYLTTGLITSQIAEAGGKASPFSLPICWTRPHLIGQCTKFASIMRSEGKACTSGNEKIDVVFNDNRIECLRYGHSLTVISAICQQSIVSYDTPGYINGAYIGGQYCIVYTVDGGLKAAFSNLSAVPAQADADEALSIDPKYNQVREGYLHIWDKPGDVVDIKIALEHNHQVAVGESINITVRAINQLGGGKHDAIITCSAPTIGTIMPAETVTDRHGYARFTYTKTGSMPESLTFACEGISKSIDIIS